MYQLTILMGFLGRDATLKSLSNNREVCQLRLATTESWSDEHGNKQRRTEWHDVFSYAEQGTFAPLIESIGLKKGAKLYMEGRIRKRLSDPDPQGHQRLYADIIVDHNTIRAL